MRNTNIEDSIKDSHDDEHELDISQMVLTLETYVNLNCGLKNHPIKIPMIQNWRPWKISGWKLKFILNHIMKTYHISITI